MFILYAPSIPLILTLLDLPSLTLIFTSLAPAKFVKGLKDISCDVDEDVTLSVTTSGSPKPSVKW